MKLLLFLLLLLSAGNIHASNYYFSSTSGNDAMSLAQAQDEATPWKSLMKLNQVFNLLAPGDTVFFKRGDLFKGAISISKSGTTSHPIVFAAYSDGAKPIISGFKILTQWAKVTDNVYEATDASLLSAVNMLVINGQPKAIGRYPNANTANNGYLTYQTSVGNTIITDKSLSASPNWSRAEVVIRKNRWTVDRNIITLHDGNAITYISQSHYSADPNFGYFIQNDPLTLDQKGEWYYVSSNKKVGVFLGNDEASVQSIKASAIKSLVFINNQNNLVFNDIVFEGANENAFEINQSLQVTINNCDIRFSGSNAITATNSSHLTVTNSTINYSNNNALTLSNCSNGIIKNNRINATGTYAGMGKGDAGSYEALLINGNNNLIELNNIDSTGYIPITFSGNSVTIKNNVITNFAFVKDDGGGIYTYNGGSSPVTSSDRHIVNNIILNGIGAGEGTSTPATPAVNGIYMDDKVNNVEIAGNTVANCAKYGIFIHNANTISLKGNTAFNNGQQLGMVHDNNAPNNPITNIELYGNILFSKEAGSIVAEYRTIDNGLTNLGTFDYNYYSRPLDDILTINTGYKTKNITYPKLFSVDGWKTASGKDVHSETAPLKLASYTLNNLIGANKYANGSFNTTISGLYAWSAAGNSAITWNSNGLDGGTLQVSFSKLTGTANRASVIIGTGSVIANKNYILRFSLKGTNDNKSLQAYLRQSKGTYTDLSKRAYVKVNAGKTDNEILFTASANESAASIVFDIEEQQQPLYLDNIQLYEADITPIDHDKNILFQYNATASAKTITLTDNYVDVANKQYTGSFTMSPFTSLVLMRQTGGAKDTATPSVSCSASGTILLERWNGIAGNNINSIPVNENPAATSQLTSLEINTLDVNYGTKVCGYLCAPQSGNYKFFISGDDAAEIWLSTDDNPQKKVKVAFLVTYTNFRQWDKFPSQTSAIIGLLKDKRYYIEVLNKQSYGQGHFSVAWQLPDGNMEIPVAGSHLAPYLPVAVSKKSQTINFAAITPKTLGDAPFTLPATAASGLIVNLSISSGPATSIDNIISLTGVGTVVVQAAQLGNSQYNAAPVVIQKIIVSPSADNGSCTAAGTILLQQWANAAGNTVATIPLQNTPTASGQLSILEIPSVPDNSGTRMLGYICPPQSGNYTFFISGDDAAELWLSTDNNPQNKTRVACFVRWTGFRQWDKFPSQTSALIHLTAGQKCYVEVLLKQGRGGGNISIGWAMPNGISELPIPGTRLSPYIFSASSSITSAMEIDNNAEKIVSPNDLNMELLIYPNPIINIASIEYHVSHTGTARLVIVDVNGREIKQLFKGLVKIGTSKKFIIDGYLTNGIYFVKLFTNTQIISQKIMVGK